MGSFVKSKRRCCKARPRCKRCPVVCDRLEKAGYMERESPRRWLVVEKVPKKALKAARAKR